jgi:hypothetical protein
LAGSDQLHALMAADPVRMDGTDSGP